MEGQTSSSADYRLVPTPQSRNPRMTAPEAIRNRRIRAQDIVDYAQAHEAQRNELEEVTVSDIDNTLAERRATRSALQRHNVGQQAVERYVASTESEDTDA